MIEAKDLRIGNTVYAKHHNNDSPNPNKFNLPVQIGQILKYEIITLSGERIGLKYLEPIPLTEEWLVKMGFGQHKTNEDGEYIYTLQTGLCQFIKKNGYMYIKQNCSEVGLNNIDTVHRFQNLYFALTGEELTIK
jgi:hypothetical protein